MSDRRVVVVRILMAGLVAVAPACGRGVAPTAPDRAAGSSLSPAGGVSTATWACLTASRAGVFGAGLQGCPVAMGTTQSLRVDAAAVAPAGVANLSSTVSGTTVTLHWQAPGSGDPATSYVIEAGSSSGLSDLVAFDTGDAATSFVATGVPAGRYFVRVRARNAAGTGPASNEVIVIVGAAAPPCASAPGAPTGLSATVSGATVTLTWTAPDGSACPPTSYTIEAGSATGLSNLAIVGTGTTATTFTAPNLPSGMYFVRVRGASLFGVSGPSNEVVVTVGATPNAPPSDLITCARISSDATNLDHTLYIDSYPGSSIQEVDLFFTSRDAAGSYAARLTVLANGAAIGSASAGVGVALNQSVLASFIFSPPLSIAPRSRVRLIASQTGGPGELKLEGQSLSTCPVTVAADSVSTTQAGPRMPIRIVGAP